MMARDAFVIDDNVVVWFDGRQHLDVWGDQKCDIYGYDLSTGQEFPIRVGPASFRSDPEVSGNLVVWLEVENGRDCTIYGAYVPEPGCLGLLLVGSLAALRRRRDLT
jgi:hypothetical protein